MLIAAVDDWITFAPEFESLDPWRCRLLSLVGTIDVVRAWLLLFGAFIVAVSAKVCP